IEDCRKKYIKHFKNNRIILFPQTKDFSNTDKGLRSEVQSLKIIKSHPELDLFVRESTSFKSLRALGVDRVYLCPDIVLSGDVDVSDRHRSGVVTLLRDDSESHLSKLNRTSIIQITEDMFSKVTVTDTHLGEDTKHNHSSLSDELDCLMGQISKAEILITDRLHGMILAYLSNTPCIVFSNSNHKIKATYNDWLKNSERVVFFKDFNENKLIEAMESIRKNELKNNTKLNKEFDILRNTILCAY
ncbi:polysaccharide pyruvyl transferase family protein, partial [Vibrio jasicida]|uniref:polysaccharide pyruvyl transferase family protein n=1 Tax=Vibrio jasicida TaxID=766224 RepID=UPI0015E48BA9